MAKSNFQLSGNLLGLILAVLEEEPLHGYGIAREIERRSAKALSFGEGALYPALRSHEGNGFIEGKWDTQGEHGPARKVYRLTPEGHAELVRLRVAWLEYSRSIDRVLIGQPAAEDREL